MTKPIQITTTTAGRADKELARQFPGAGRRQLAEMFDDGCVTLRGKRAKKGDMVAVGDVLELTRMPAGDDDLRPTPDPDLASRLALLLERDDVVVIDKPAGVPSQPLRPGELGTIANALAHRFPECRGLGDDPRDGGLVHRLDIGTSGALVAARTEAAYRGLRDAFRDGRVDKRYVAITDGRPVSRECDAPLAQRGKKVVVDHTDGLAAYTAFTVERASSTHAVVRCDARTGRMHQVRAHLAYVGAPIAGDALYGGAPVSGHDGFFLHASVIAVPVGDERVIIEAPSPQRFRDALAALGL